MNLRFSIKRWWHSKGFSIESKTDYAFLQDVIHARWPYYAYEEMRQNHPDCGTKDMRQAQLLLRMANYFRPTDVNIIGNTQPITAEAIRHGCRHTSILHDNSPYITLPQHNISGKIEQGYAVMFHSDKATSHGQPIALLITDIHGGNITLWQQLADANTITFDMRTIGIVIFDPNRYPEHYTLRL